MDLIKKSQYNLNVFPYFLQQTGLSGTSIPVFSKPVSVQPIMPKDEISKSPEFKSNVIQSPLFEIEPYEHPTLLPSYPKKMHVFNPMKMNKFPGYQTKIQPPKSDIPIYKPQRKLKSGKSYIPNKNEIFKVKEKASYTMFLKKDL